MIADKRKFAFVKLLNPDYQRIKKIFFFFLFHQKEEENLFSFIPNIDIKIDSQEFRRFVSANGNHS